MTEKYSSDLYPREVIIKTAYSFTDKYYVHLDLVGTQYSITVTPKSGTEDEDMIKNKLDNEIVSQIARYTVSSKTAHIRQLIMARAFSSSVIIGKADIPEYDPEYVSAAENILKDWFEHNGA